MIASRRNYPFNSRVTTIHTTMYSCMVSTSKEGLFKKQSTMVFETPAGQLRPRRAVAKIIYADSLRPGDRLQMHDIVAKLLNEAGESVSLGNALERCSKSLKGSGVASEVINLLWEDKATVTESIDRSEDSGITEMSTDEEESEAESHETPEQQLAQLEAENAKLREQLLIQKVGLVGLAIVKASQACSEMLKPMLNIADEKEKQQAEIYVFYEFIYFFMHLTMRSAFSQLTEQQIARLQDFLGPLVSSTAIDSFFAHWPEDLKDKMRSEFLTKLNAAELEYSTCKELFSKGSPLTGNSLFSRLARNVAELSGNSTNPPVLVLIIDAAAEALETMSLDSVVRDAGNFLS